MLYAVLAALLLVQAYGEPVVQASRKLAVDGNSMHQGRDILEANCGCLGCEQCGDGGCDDDLVPVNLGGLSTICRTPEEAAAQLGQDAVTTSFQEEEDPAPEPETTAATPETAVCGCLGCEQCDGGECDDDLVPVNLGGLSTICRTPEEAAAQLGQDTEDEDSPAPEEDDTTPAPEEEDPAPEPETTAASPETAVCGCLGCEQCDGGECDDDLVPVNLGGLSTICRTPEEAAAQRGQRNRDEESPAPEQDDPTPAPETAAGPDTAVCGCLGCEQCPGGECDDDLVPVNKGGLSTICRKPEEATPGPDTPEPTPPTPTPEPTPPTPTPEPTPPAPTPEPDTPEPTPAPEAAPTPEPTAPAPAVTPIGDDTFSGELTFYGGAGEGGACTSSYVPSGYTTVALNSPQYTEQNQCGSCVSACYTVDGSENCFNAIVDNLCPECAYGDLDLGESGDGRWDLTWSWITCPSDGITWNHQGSNASYAKIKAEGGPASMSSMTCNGIEGSVTDDGYFVFNDSGEGLSEGTKSCTVKFSDGSSVTEKGV